MTMQAARHFKPGLGLLLSVELGPELVGTATAAVTAALALPGLACVASLADKRSKRDGQYEQASDAPYTYTPDLVAPRSFLSLLAPASLAVVFAKNIGLNLLLRFNLYMVELNDHEYKRLVAEEEGSLPPPPPQLAKLDEAVQSGVYFGFRELATTTVRIAYEHLLDRRLGRSKAQPFLRNGFTWVSDVLCLKHAGKKASKKVFSYTFALLHAQALGYAAECTVSVGQGVYAVMRDKERAPRRKALQISKIVVFQVARCSLLLLVTSVVASVGTLAKPGFGTRAGAILTDQGVNIMLHPVGRLLLA